MAHSGEFPKVSIIIVTLNANNTLQECLDSIYKQEYPNIEVVLLDALSTDGTVDILQANSYKISYWRSEKDNGIYDAMNKAIDHTTGDWLYFLGSDDVLFDDFSKFAFQLADQNIIYYANVLRKDEKYRGEVTAYQHAKGTICHQAIIYPRRVFDKYRFNTKYRISADHELNMRCWKDKSLRFKYVDLVVANFNHTGASSKPDRAFLADQATLIRQNHGFIPWLRFAIRQYRHRKKNVPESTN